MTTKTERRTAAAIWSNIAEPGDTWSGALRHQMGVGRALEWAMGSFSPPPAEAPGGEVGTSADRGWQTAYKRWHARIATLNHKEDLEQLERLGGRLVTPEDEEWPEGLNDLEDRMPPALWVVGAPIWNSRTPQLSVSMVGSRAATSYGARVAGEIAFDLAERGVVVVSGGAYGIDAAAHRGALDARDLLALETRNRERDPETGGRAGLPQVSDQGSAATPGGERAAEAYPALSPSTIVVICGGLGNLYPPGNRRLFDRVLQTEGSLVAEVPPSFRPARWRFLERNRLIAAWSPITIVVEAGIRSGALATANRAIDLGREVGAVPGRVDSAASMGPHELLREGALLIADGADVIAVLDPSETADLAKHRNEFDRHAGLPGVSTQTAQILQGLPPLAQRVWEALPLMGEATSQSIAKVAGISEDEAGAGLLSLHVVGLARLEDGKWCRGSATI